MRANARCLGRAGLGWGFLISYPLYKSPTIEDKQKVAFLAARQGCIKLAETARTWQGGQSSARL